MSLKITGYWLIWSVLSWLAHGRKWLSFMYIEGDFLKSRAKICLVRRIESTAITKQNYFTQDLGSP